MIPREVRAVVFDAVGTLIHPDPPAPVVYADVGRRFGSRHRREEIAARFDAAFKRQEELDEKAGWRTSEVREHDRWRAIVGDVLDDVRNQEACFQELFAYFGRPTAWRCDPDAAAVLGHLAGDGLSLALASNYDGRLRQVVAGRPELASVSQIMTSSELGWRKPAKEFFVAVCKRLGLSPTEILYVGNDRANDYIGATTAGLHALLLDPADRSSEDAKRIASLVELMDSRAGFRFPMDEVKLSVGAREVAVETFPLPVRLWLHGLRIKRLRRVSESRWVLCPSRGFWTMTSVLVLLGLCQITVGLSLHLWNFLGVGVLVTLIGVAIGLCPTRTEFDKGAGVVTRRRLWFKERFPLADVLAFQLVEGDWHIGFRRRLSFHYQLNLVLDSPTPRRENLLVHDHWEWPWQGGNQLADFLKVPMLDCVPKLHPEAPSQAPNWWGVLQNRRPIVRVIAVIVLLVSVALALARFGQFVWQEIEATQK